MNANARKSRPFSENPEQSLTVFDAPNVCRQFMDKCQSLESHADPEVAKIAAEMRAEAKQMLDAIVASVDQLLALED